MARVPDVFDYDYAEEYGDGQEYETSCKYCGLSYLHWQQLNGKWRLFSGDGKLHSCLNKSSVKKDNE